MSQNAVELCLLVVGDLFGDVAVRVLELLFQYGRLTHLSLLRHAALAPRQLKHTLVVLVHQELVKCYQPEAGVAACYEADWATAYALVRSGRAVAAVVHQLGSLAGSVLSHVITNGHTRVSDLVNSTDIITGAASESSTKTLKANGLANGKRKRAEASNVNLEDPMHQAIYDLLEAGYLTVLHESHLRPQADNVMEATIECKRRMQYFGVLKKAEQAEVDRAVKDLLQVWKFNAGGARTQGMVNSLKRQCEDADVNDHISNKKRKVSGGYASNDAIHLNLDLILRVNHEKLAVMDRNQHLVNLVEQQISRPCSKVYAAFLNKIHKDIKACIVDVGLTREDVEEGDDTGPGLTTRQVADLTRATLSLVGSVGSFESTQLKVEHDDHPKKRRRKAVLDDDDDVDENGNASGIVHDHDLEDDEMDYNDYVPKKMKDPAVTSQTHETWVKKNLHILASHEPPFLNYHPGSTSSPDRWTISFAPLSAALRLAEIHAVIGHAHTRASLRLIRILSEKGVLDEKALTGLSLLPVRELRRCLTAMHEAGHLELQEIPRDTNRQAAKSMFLWFFDAERVRKRVLEDTYKAMARAVQRARAERRDATVRAVVEKAGRSDVRGREEEFLSAAERQILGAWREREERLLGAVARMDALVAVLRDY